MMRTFLHLAAVLLVALLGASCAGNKSAGTAGPSPSRAKANPPLIVTPASVLSGKVLRLNQAARFVVLVFPIGQMPTIGQRLTVYRGGLKTGEVRITGPQRDDKIVADLVAGEAAEGDEVRTQ